MSDRAIKQLFPQLFNDFIILLTTPRLVRNRDFLNKFWVAGSRYNDRVNAVGEYGVELVLARSVVNYKLIKLIFTIFSVILQVDILHDPRELDLGDVVVKLSE